MRWWSLPGSNRRPSACKADALPTELRPLLKNAGAWLIHTKLEKNNKLLSKNYSVRLTKTTTALVWRNCRDKNPYLVPLSRDLLLRKEVIQPLVPQRLPCYDFIPITSPTFGCCFPRVSSQTSGRTGFHDVTGGVYKARERIHGVIADTPLLAIPASWSRVADSNPNWARL